jgi:hypothetical protein
MSMFGPARGAMRGRSVRPSELHAERVRLNQGGYDSSGRYWGQGAPLYHVYDDQGLLDTHVRAPDAPTAKRRAVTDAGGVMLT